MRSRSRWPWPGSRCTCGCAAWPYLAVGVLGVTLVVPEAVIDWTDGALVPPALCWSGADPAAASLGGFRMRKELEQPEADRPAKAVDELV